MIRRLFFRRGCTVTVNEDAGLGPKPICGTRSGKPINVVKILTGLSCGGLHGANETLAPCRAECEDATRPELTLKPCNRITARRVRPFLWLPDFGVQTHGLGGASGTIALCSQIAIRQ
jgi:hypothetical protein